MPSWSPSGSRIAFVCRRGDALRVCVTSHTGEETRDVADSQPGGGFGSVVTWLSDDMLLVQTSSHRDFDRIDLRGGAEPKPLLGPLASLGHAFWPAVSHDGKRVAFYWNRTDSGRAIWVIPSEGGEPRRVVQRGYAGPIGWSKDDRWIYINESATHGLLTSLSAVDATGQLPPRKVDQQLSDLAMSADGKTLLLIGGDRTTDAWIADLPEPAR